MNRHSLADIHIPIVTQGLTSHCDRIVTVFLGLFQQQHLLRLDIVSCPEAVEVNTS